MLHLESSKDGARKAAAYFVLETGRSVNGMPVWSRGANVVPMEEMEGRASALALRTMVESAVSLLR